MEKSRWLTRFLKNQRQMQNKNSFIIEYQNVTEKYTTNNLSKQRALQKNKKKILYQVFSILYIFFLWFCFLLFCIFLYQSLTSFTFLPVWFLIFPFFSFLFICLIFPVLFVTQSYRIIASCFQKYKAKLF